MGPTEKPKQFSKTVKRLINTLSPYSIALLFVLVCALGSTIFSIIGPKILGSATTEIFRGVMAKLTMGGSINFSVIGKILRTLVIIYLISALFSFVQGYITSTITQKIAYSFRKELTNKIHRMSMSSFDKTSHGDILSRVTNDIDTVSQNLNQGMVQIISASATIVGVCIMMLSISVLMTLVTFAILPLSLVIIGRIVKLSQKYFVEQQKSLGTINGHIEEVYSAHQVVKAFGAESQERETFTQTNEKLYESAWKSQFLSGLMMPVMHSLGDLGYVAVALLGGMFAIRGSIAVGDIQAFIQYMRNFTQPLAQVAQISHMIQSTVAAAERIFAFLDGEEEKQDQCTELPKEVTGPIEFSHVSFGYTKEQKVIKDFSACIKRGDKVAIVGPTGAGKTTIVKLLMRFYDCDEGSIFIGGEDISTCTRDSVRSQFGMVLQDTWLFSGTIGDNIRYGNITASDQMIEDAAKAARVDHFIHTLPDGYNMVINEDSSNISQGQRQLITIARAILANPTFLILDEATSSVDTRTEILIQEAMDHLMAGRTSFIIAHRLSTIKHADIILVMQDGDIVEKGTHEQLLSANGFYATLYRAQFSSLSEALY